jgi:hypothetical protein
MYKYKLSELNMVHNKLTKYILKKKLTKYLVFSCPSKEYCIKRYAEIHLSIMEWLKGQTARNFLWYEVVRTATYLINSMPSRVTSMKSLCELILKNRFFCSSKII